MLSLMKLNENLETHILYIALHFPKAAKEVDDVMKSHISACIKNYHSLNLLRSVNVSGHNRALICGHI